MNVFKQPVDKNVCTNFSSNKNSYILTSSGAQTAAFNEKISYFNSSNSTINVRSKRKSTEKHDKKEKANQFKRVKTIPAPKVSPKG